MSWLAEIYPDSPMPLCVMKGKSAKVFDFIRMLVTTFPAEIDKEWWESYLTIHYQGGSLNGIHRNRKEG